MKKISNWGGFLLNPPDKCQAIKKIIVSDLTWVDLGICFSMCKDKCDEYKNYMKMDEKQKRMFLISNGVYLPLSEEEKAEIEANKLKSASKYKRR